MGNLSLRGLHLKLSAVGFSATMMMKRSRKRAMRLKMRNGFADKRRKRRPLKMTKK